MKRTLLAALAAVIGTAATAQEHLSVALDWTPNTNHVGLYVAQAQGWYKDAGLEVELLPYTDTPSTTLVESGVAAIGYFTALGYYSRKAAGADLIATYATMQHETGRLVFNADRDDIQTPADLDGMTYGGFGTAWETTLVGTMIRNAGGEGQFDAVTLGTSAYEALAAGRVDFTLEVMHWEGVAAKLAGREQRGFDYADWGVPDEQNGFIGMRQDWLDAHEDTARAFMQATARGYAWAAEHPDEASAMLIEGSDGMLSDPELVKASMQAILDQGLLRDDQGRVGRFDRERFAAMGRFLVENGILTGADGQPLAAMPDFDGWVTNRLLD